jgi:hypothetical protein
MGLHHNDGDYRDYLKMIEIVYGDSITMIEVVDGDSLLMIETFYGDSLLMIETIYGDSRKMGKIWQNCNDFLYTCHVFTVSVLSSVFWFGGNVLLPAVISSWKTPCDQIHS